MVPIEMATLKMVGNKLGEMPTRRVTDEGSMAGIVEFFHQNPGFIAKDELPADWGKKNYDALNNAFHHGYILRGTLLGKEYYGIPSIPIEELTSLRAKFQELTNSPDDKRQLIDNLIHEQVSSSKSVSEISNVDVEIIQNRSLEEEEVKQSMTAKKLLKDQITKEEEEIKEFERKFKELENQIHNKKQLVNQLQSILEKL